MQIVKMGMVFLVLSFMPLFSLAAASEKQKSVDESVSSVIIDNSKKMINHSEATPFFYTETIRNISSNKPAFVNVDIYRLNNIGEKEEDLTPVKMSNDADVYAMPNQIIVPADGVRTIRVYLTKKLLRTDDQYYRIRFIPSTMPLEDDSVSNEKQRARSSLNIGMGAGQLLMVGRTKPSFDTKVYIEKDDSGKSELIIHNKGNSYIRLDNMKTCFIKTARKPCQYISGRHVNAGRTKKLPIESNVITVSLELVEGDKTRKIIYDRQAATPLKLG